MPPVTAVTTAGPGLHARACAGAALVSAGLHLVMAGQHADLWWQAALMLVMALLCLPCVLPLWRSGSAGAGRMMMGSALGMVAFHAALLLFPGGAAGGHRHDGMLPAVSAASADAAGSPFGMLALIGWELAAAMLAATWLRRNLASDQRRTPDSGGESTGCRRAAELR